MVRGARKSLLNRAAVCAGIVLVLNVQTAAAQEWKPSKNIELVVNSGAGGAGDRSVRVPQRLLQNLPGMPSVAVVNKPGGGGNLAYTYLAQHEKDAHYLCNLSTGLLTNEIVGVSKLSYRDLTPLNILLREYIAVWTHGASPIASAREIIARLKKDPASLTFGFATAPGNQNHIVIAMLAKAAGVDPKAVKTVIFASGGAGMTAALGGHVDVWVGTTGGALQHMRASKARVLGLTAPQRQEGGLEQVPTLREQGIDAEYYAWRGFIAPRGITPAQVAFWDQTFARVIKSDEWKKELADNGWADGLVGAADIRRRLDTEFGMLSAMLGELGLAARKGN
jgi:putative tricarboxylic transport membrane protein